MTVLKESHSPMTIKDGKNLIKMEQTAATLVGDKWYVLDHNWWSAFMRQIEDSGKEDNQIISMVPISNKEIVEKTSDGGYNLKPGLMPLSKIILLPEPVFFELKKVFGVENEQRDVISREVVKGTLMRQEIFIEIYPLLIKVADYKRKEDVRTISISQADSIEKIRTAIMDKLEINESDRQNAQFIIEENGQYEALPCSISHTKLSALLNDGTIVYVDSTGLATPEAVAANGSTRSGARYAQAPNYKRGLCGLQNLGNTCFMNSALQCLSNVPELTDYFINNDYNSEINESNPLGTHGRLVKAYAELLKEMWSGQFSSVRPCRLKCVIGEFAPRFNGYAQQDSQELTAFLLDGLHEDLNRIKKKPYVEEKEVDGRDESQAAIEAWQDYKKRNDSIIVDLLHGQLKSTLTCNVCAKVSIKFDPICYLSVPIPAKERQMKSSITFVRKSKWAKFSLTHTNKTTIRQIKEVIREQLKFGPEVQIVLLSFYGGDIVDDSQMIGTSYNYMTKQFYAYAIEEPGPLMLVENRSAQSNSVYNSSLGLVFPVRRPKKLTRESVLAEVLPRCRDYFWQETPSTSSTDEPMDGNSLDAEQGGGGGAEENNEQSVEESLLEGITLVETNMAPLQVFPEDPKKELVCTSPINGPVPKVVLTWRETKQFGQVNSDVSSNSGGSGGGEGNHHHNQEQDVDGVIKIKVNMQGELDSSKKVYTLKECIDLYTTQEQLNEEDSWYCPRCKAHQRAFKKLDLWALPKILIIHLKRFLYSRYTRDKIDTEIEVPVQGLDLSDKIQDPAHKQEKYDLIGISNHSGGLGSGHYTARALSENTWCEFNDSSAYALTNALGESLSSREAYMLVYRRRETADRERQQRQHQTRKSPRIAAAATF